MSQFNFKSAICTNRQQSERLLSLGLKKETADMVLLKEMIYDEENHCTRDGDNYLIRPIDYLEGEEHRGHIPAWSLHRLIEMMPREIESEVENGLSIDLFHTDYDGVTYYEVIGYYTDKNLYNAVISCIADLIKEGYFNKEYLYGND